jgi:hypothetical protein
MTTADQQPAFVTAEECRKWMAVTPLGNAVQALAHLLRQLNLLNRHAVAPHEHLAILEVLRKPILVAQEEGARRFVGKPLPLVPPEQAAFDAGQAIWQALLRGYGRCIEAELSTNIEPGKQFALLIQRAFTVLAAAQYDIYRAGFAPATGHWHALHDLYATAEKGHVAETPVEDPVRQGKTTSSPGAVYAEMLLLHAASPHELPTRHLAWVARWARRWARKVKIVATTPALDGESIPLNLDLDSDLPAGYQPIEGSGARWLDTSEVRNSLKKRLNLLEKGTSPAELHLGDDCTQPACGQVLKHVYQRWCRGGSARKHERRTTTGSCELVAGVEAIYFHLSNGQSFRQPGYSNDEALRRERDEIATFGGVAPRSLGGIGQKQGHRAEQWNVVEEWQLVDESATGLHATHALDATLDRVNQRQLVAVRPPAATTLLIGCLRWSMITGDSRLHVGIFILPGRPETVSIRAMDLADVKEPYRPGFLLPAVAATGSSASIITPPGYFRFGRIVEIAEKQNLRVRLLHLLDRGIDFDRISYEVVT